MKLVLSYWSLIFLDSFYAFIIMSIPSKKKPYDDLDDDMNFSFKDPAPLPAQPSKRLDQKQAP